MNSNRTPDSDSIKSVGTARSKDYRNTGSSAAKFKDLEAFKAQLAAAGNLSIRERIRLRGGQQVIPPNKK